jgi:site-specific DNA-methyltransferase (adenine-specific)
LKWGTGGINIDGCRVEFDLNNKEDLHAIDQWNRQAKSGVKVFNQEGNAKLQEFNQKAPQGRFPANLIHDGSDEVVGLFPNSKGASSQNNYSNGKIYRGQSLLESESKLEGYRDWYNDNGSASRFFYCAKSSKSERNKGCEELEEKAGIRTNAPRENEDVKTPTRANNHPTVKPIALMEYLVKLVSREGSTVLDPFMGSGSTGIACKKLNREFIGIEREADYIKIAEARIEAHEPEKQRSIL